MKKNLAARDDARSGPLTGCKDLSYRYGYVYLTTNLVNGKMYVGKKANKYFRPMYLGSGTVLAKAIKKYGNDFMAA